MNNELLPCPFCGAGDTVIKPNGRVWTGMKYSEPSSVSVQHWCTPTPGQPSRMVERVGRDEPSAIAAWNKRHLHARPLPVGEVTLSGETEAQRMEVVAAWNDLPESLACHPGLKRLYLALGGIKRAASPEKESALPVGEGKRNA